VVAVATVGGVVQVWWKCGGSVVEVWWTCGGSVVEVWWKCGGSVVEVWWKCGGSVCAVFFLVVVFPLLSFRACSNLYVVVDLSLTSC